MADLKPSKLKKDDQFNARINRKTKILLLSIGMTAQKILDNYIDRTLTVKEDLIIEQKLTKENMTEEQGQVARDAFAGNPPSGGHTPRPVNPVNNPGKTYKK